MLVFLQSSALYVLFLLYSIATAARRENSHSCIGFESCRIFGAEVLDPSVGVDEQIFAGCTILASFQSIWLDSSPLAEDAHLDIVFEELDFPDDADASFECALASTALPYRKLSQSNRVSDFQDLRVGYPCICHVGVNSILAAPVGARPVTSSYGFVIPEVFVSKGQVIHAPLGSSTGLEGFEH